VIDMTGGSDNDALGVGSHRREERFDGTKEANPRSNAARFGKTVSQIVLPYSGSVVLATRGLE
jgi:hypothetical protein